MSARLWLACAVRDFLLAAFDRLSERQQDKIIARWGDPYYSHPFERWSPVCVVLGHQWETSPRVGSVDLFHCPGCNWVLSALDGRVDDEPGDYDMSLRDTVDFIRAGGRFGGAA